MKLLKKISEEPLYRSDRGALCIDCRSCIHRHDIDDPECLRCIVKGIISAGECSRIILRDDSDIEYYGDSVSVFVKMAEAGILIMNLNRKEDMKKCRVCRARPSAVSSSLWPYFPKIDANEIRHDIMRHEPHGKICEECLVRTYHSLESIEFLLNEISKDAARCAFSLVGE